MKMPEIPAGLPVQWCPGTDPDGLAQALAVRVAAKLQQALDANGTALLVVSGGSTPQGFLARLAEMPLDWARVAVTLTDERWVAADDPARNSRMVRQWLLRGPAAGARFHELLAGEADDPGAAAVEASSRLQQLAWPATVVVLGMGEDGHTASLFPDAPELARALAREAPLAVALTPPSQRNPRITLSAPALAGAGLTVLLVQGEGKRKTVEWALSQPDAIEQAPIRAFFQQPLDIFWCP